MSQTDLKKKPLSEEPTLTSESRDAYFEVFPVEGYFNQLERGQDKDLLVGGAILSLDAEGNTIGQMGVIEDYDKKTGMARIKLWPSMVAQDGSKMPNITLSVLLAAGIPWEHIISKNRA